MIGLVIVSHSAKLAEGVVDLARGMVGADFPIAAAGGLAEPDVLGTDALRVLQAIESVFSDDGVLVLTDLGSAILSAEMALDFLAPEQRLRARLCPAPLVEGTVAAAVAARGGAALEAVFAAARAGLDAKAQQLGSVPELPPAPLVPAPPIAAPERTIVLTVPNRLGLHARPAARLVEIAGRFNTAVTIRNLTNNRTASARSFNGLMLLGAVGGHTLEVSVSGADAEQALAALQAFAAANFGDPPNASDTPMPFVPAPLPMHAPGVQNRLRGLPAAPGITIGAAAHYRPALPTIPFAPAGSAGAEIAALQAAVEQTRAQIEAQRAQTERQLGADSAGIFAAHLAFLADADLLASAQQQIEAQSISAAAAWQQATDALIAQYRQLEFAYQQARAADVAAVQAQVLIALLGTGTAALALREPAILIARDLTPAEIGALDADKVLGILTAEGSPTSHAAILARTLGIPMVVGLGASILTVADGTPLAADGETGNITLQPDEEMKTAFTRLASQFRARQESALRESALPARTADGQRVEVVANIGSLPDAERALELGAEGVGVLRTEFLFMQREVAPSADEQYAAYRAIAQAMGGRPLVIRTLDAGGDKPLPYLKQPHEDNPFLGLRAVRLCLAYPDFFRAQLAAIVRVADEFPVRVMFPMIATVEEFRAAKALLAACGRPAHPIRTGMMVEIPAAVECAEQFAPEVDFFSIGTNDLTQYAFAAERGNPQLAYLADALHPAILRLIERVVAVGRTHGRPVAVCGELASDPAAIPILLGLGVDELSMSAAAIPQAKAVIRQVQQAVAAKLAQQALAQPNAEEVRRLVMERNA